MDDFARDRPLAARLGTGYRVSGGIRDCCAEVRQARSARERGSPGRKDVAAVKGGRGAGGNGERHELRIIGKRREDPVIGPNEEVPGCLRRQRAPRRADAWIHDREMHRTRRKSRPRSAEHECAGADVPRRDVVTHVHELHARRS